MNDYRDKKMLEGLYLNEGLSTLKIGDMFGVYSATISSQLIKHGIPRREMALAVSMGRRNNLSLSEKAKEFINGELLGDMCIIKGSEYASSISYSSKYRDYIVWLDKVLLGFGVERAGQINKHIDKGHGAIRYRYYSLRYPELKEIYNVFYPKGVKVIPENLVFSPIVLRQWYIGDGCLYFMPNKGRTRQLALCTHCFSFDCVHRAVEQLNELGFISRHQKANNMIGISTHSISDFLDYIGPCPVECYQYKWAIS
ncbi:hypothetical protein LCGC14_1345080 [marine sediment metagenome]|uniref:Homing endonuclease LAGLIDADG domain-containing protein n=1 Tax=marine sediment metagenome TaxID=412755 RepID=A0A0F9NEY5_9ZZZZ